MSRSAYWQGNKTNRSVMKAIANEGLTPTYVRAGLNGTEALFTGDIDQAAYCPPAAERQRCHGSLTIVAIAARIPPRCFPPHLARSARRE
jgi:hypothetical protein